MSFFDKVQKSWENGIKGTEEVPLKQGIEAVLKTAQKVEENNRQPEKVPKHEENSK